MRRTHWIAPLVVAAMTTAHAQQPGRYDVSRFGAVGDGRAIDTDAINKAIDAAVAGGGGTVVCDGVAQRGQPDPHLFP